MDAFNAEIYYKTKICKISGEEFPFVMQEIGHWPRIAKVSEVLDCPEWMTDVVEAHNVFREELGHCVKTEPLSIVTEGSPIKQRPYRQALTKRRVVEEEIEKMLKAKVI